ncbi:hypothetical protein GCM10007919_28730 [Rhizobium indigoferae]|nr:hypothetical protein GCM10007919_28730 [Rhizobium indigoferae]
MSGPKSLPLSICIRRSWRVKRGEADAEDWGRDVTMPRGLKQAVITCLLTRDPARVSKDNSAAARKLVKTV